jgi:N6-adenosine-specific RNA methylase IME4
MSYGVILCDPPWRYSFSRSKSRKVENQYPTMTLEEIKDLPIDDWAGKRGKRIGQGDPCVLFLWVPAPKLEQAFEVLKAWNFSYKSGFVWDKKRKGMGYYGRGRHEHLLIATRGKPGVPKPKDRPDSILEERRAPKHSKKPVCAYEAIERMYPDKTKIELFARNRRPGWDAFGDEVPEEKAA